MFDAARILPHGAKHLDIGHLVCDSDFYAKLLKEDWIPASQIAAEVKVRGTIGMCYGCQVIVSDRVKGKNFHIVKPGALALFMKRDTLVEIDRDILNQSTVIAGSKLFAPYLLNSANAIKLEIASSGSTDTYTAVSSPSGNPSEQGWYELDGETYSLTTDTTVQSGKTYYTKDNG